MLKLLCVKNLPTAQAHKNVNHIPEKEVFIFVPGVIAKANPRMTGALAMRPFTNVNNPRMWLRLLCLALRAGCRALLTLSRSSETSLWGSLMAALKPRTCTTAKGRAGVQVLP